MNQPERVKNLGSGQKDRRDMFRAHLVIARDDFANGVRRIFDGSFAYFHHATAFGLPVLGVCRDDKEPVGELVQETKGRVAAAARMPVLYHSGQPHEIEDGLVPFKRRQPMVELFDRLVKLLAGHSMKKIIVQLWHLVGQEVRVVAPSVRSSPPLDSLPRAARLRDHLTAGDYNIQGA